jgi:hypothetical protein
VILAAEGTTRLLVYCTVTFGLVLPNSVALYTGQAFYGGLAILDARWIACYHKSRCQLAAQLTVDLGYVCVSKRGHCVESQTGRSPAWKRKVLAASRVFNGQFKDEAQTALFKDAVRTPQ